MTAGHGPVAGQREVVLLGDLDTVDLAPDMAVGWAKAGLRVTACFGFSPTELHRPGIGLVAVEPIIEALAAIGPGKDLLIPYPTDFAGPHQVDYLAEVVRLRGARVLVGEGLQLWRAGTGSPTSLTVVMGCRYLVNLMTAVAAKAAEPALIDEVWAYLPSDEEITS